MTPEEEARENGREMTRALRTLAEVAVHTKDPDLRERRCRAILRFERRALALASPELCERMRKRAGKRLRQAKRDIERLFAGEGGAQ